MNVELGFEDSKEKTLVEEKDPLWDQNDIYEDIYMQIMGHG